MICIGRKWVEPNLGIIFAECGGNLRQGEHERHCTSRAHPLIALYHLEKIRASITEETAHFVVKGSD
jgi:hypothetical protein